MPSPLKLLENATLTFKVKPQNAASYMDERGNDAIESIDYVVTAYLKRAGNVGGAQDDGRFYQETGENFSLSGYLIEPQFAEYPLIVGQRAKIVFKQGTSGAAAEIEGEFYLTQAISSTQLAREILGDKISGVMELRSSWGEAS